METKIHEYQISILRELLFNPKSKFSELKKVDIENDHFAKHIKHLVNEGLISKKEGRYSLTDEGKEFANRMDTESLKLERQAKIGIALHAVRKIGNKTEYLIHQRLKEPFYGWYGSHTGKIKWGETPLQCAKREFFEETGLGGSFNLKGIVHFHHFHEDGRLLEDKYFWVFKITKTTGKLIENVHEGKNIWMSENEYKNLKNVFASFDEMIEVINSKKLIYLDRIKIVNSY